MAEKRGFRIPFEFIPMPVDSITADPPLSLAELKILLYLLKQVRFGESPQPLTDDEILNGTFDQDGEREDQGCGLSRGAFKSGRKDLVDRGWLELESASTDKSRPRFIHRLVIENNRQTAGVKKRHLVSKNDTDNERHLVSTDDSAVSKNDSAVSKNDTSNNKEIESTYRNTSLEGERPPSPTILIAREKLSQFILRNAPSPREPDYDRRLFDCILSGRGGLTPTQVKEFLAEDPEWRKWEYLALLDSQEEIEFPATPEPKQRGQRATPVSPERVAEARSLGFEILELRSARKPTDELRQKLGRCIGTMSVDTIADFLESLEREKTA